MLRWCGISIKNAISKIHFLTERLLCVLVVAASSTSTMYVCVCPMLPVELVVAGRERRGRNPVDFLIKGKQFLNDLPRLVDSLPCFFFFRDAKNGPFLWSFWPPLKWDMVHWLQVGHEELFLGLASFDKNC